MNRSGLRPRSALSSAVLLLAAGVVLAASCAESPEASGECADGLSRCNGECVELQANAEHCGACGEACEEGQLCVGGRCGEGGGGGEGGGDIGTGVGGGEECREGQADCSGRCVNLETDPRNCGDCDVECAEGRVCADGSCACAGDLTECDGACVDVLSDRLNCGECGIQLRACPAVRRRRLHLPRRSRGLRRLVRRSADEPVPLRRLRRRVRARGALPGRRLHLRPRHV